MLPDRFTESASGVLIRDPRGHVAFVPNPLPDAMALDPGSIKLLVEAQDVLGELRGVGRFLPNPQLLIRPFLRQEAVLSSRIEGTTSGLQQLMLFEADPTADDGRSDVHEVANYVRALDLGFELLDSMPICLRLICQVHETLMSGVRGEGRRPGEFRQEPVVIGHRGATLETARFVPPPVMEMRQALNDLEQYIGYYDGQIPLLVHLALVHYQFEAIHPFMDGNGRMGRLLIALQLREREALPQPLLYLSGYFERHQDTYRDLLLRVSTHGDWKAWIDFFLQGVRDQAVDSLQRSHQLLDLQGELRAWADSASHARSLGALVELAFAKPALSIGDIESALRLTPPAARSLAKRMEDAGYLREITGRARNRRYAIPQMLEILSTS